MKKKALSLLLASTMVISLTACGGGGDDASSSSSNNTNNDAAASNSSSNDAASGDTAASNDTAGDTASGEKPDYHEVLKDGITVVVNGTLTASVDNGQADFEKQWEEAVGIDLTIQQLDHSGYTDAVGRLFASQDYPDAMIMSAEMFKQYAPTGLLWEIGRAHV